jgi:hypothetical protein
MTVHPINPRSFHRQSFYRTPIPSIEFPFEELNLIVDLDPTDHNRAVGYLSGMACIAIEGEGYIIDDVCLTNTAKHGTGTVLITACHPLHSLLDASLRAQFDQHITEWIDEEEAEAHNG